MNRKQAYNLIDKEVKNKNLIKHMLATEAIMQALARKLKKNEEKWGITGLLHDLDFEKTKNNPKKHGLVTEEILQNEDIDLKIVEAIKTHNAETLGIERKSELDFALICAEQLTGLIVACALVRPDKKLASVKVDSILKKFREKNFAANIDRDLILKCEKIGFKLEDFIKIGLKAMQSVSGDLEL